MAEERTERWTGGSDETAEEQGFNGLELAEVPTAPAHLEDQGNDLGAAPGNPRPARQAQAAVATPAPARRRGGKPRLSEEQDLRIIAAFEQAKKENRSLKEVAAELGRELGQPADYINQRYYYLQRKGRPEGAEAPAGRRGRGRPARVEAPAEPAAPPVGRRRGRRPGRAATAAPAQAQLPEAAAAPATATPDLGSIARSLDQLTELTRSQLGAIVDRLQKVESRLDSIEQRPAGDVAVDQVLERLGQVLQERGRTMRSRERVRSAVQEFLKAIDENL